MGSLRCLLGDGLRGDGLGISSPLLRCHSSCYRGKSGSGECGLLPGAIRGGRHGVVWLLLVAGWRMWCVGMPSSLWFPSYSEVTGAGAPDASVIDVSVIMQLKFQQSFVEFSKCLSFSSSTEWCAVLCDGLHMPVVRVETVQKTVVFQQLHVLTVWSTSLLCSSWSWVVQFLDMAVDMPVGMQLSGFAESCSKTVELPQLPGKFGSRATCLQRLVPMVQTSRLDGHDVWATHYLDDELRVFSRALYTFTRPGAVSTGTRPP